MLLLQDAYYILHSQTINFQSRLVLCVNCKMFLCIKIYISISHYNEPDIDVQVSITLRPH